MSQALHSGFDRMTRDPAHGFSRLAPAILHIDALVEAFADALAQEGAAGHLCFALDPDARRVLLTQSGDTSADVMDRAGPVTFSIDMRGDHPLLLAIDCPQAPDRHRLARLHGLAVVYAIHAATLIEAEEDAPTMGALTPVERRCLHLVLAGLSHLDIGEQLGLSVPAVGIFLRRAAERLGVQSPREACAVAMARGLLT